MGAVTLATDEDVRVGLRSLETEASASDLLGHKHSDIYRHSTLNRHRPLPDIMDSLFGASW